VGGKQFTFQWKLKEGKVLVAFMSGSEMMNITVRIQAIGGLSEGSKEQVNWMAVLVFEDQRG
jgi:hypothetical protein